MLLFTAFSVTRFAMHRIYAIRYNKTRKYNSSAAYLTEITVCTLLTE